MPSNKKPHSADSSQRFSRKETIILIALLILGLAGFFVPKDFKIENWEAADAIHALADALFISAALGLTVDYTLKRTLVSEIVKEVSPFIMGFNLPDEFKNELHNLATTFVYKSHVEYLIDISNDSSGVIVFRMKARWYFNNISDRSQPVNFNLALRICKQVYIDRCEVLNGGVRNAVTEAGSPVNFEARPSDLVLDRDSDKHLFWKRWGPYYIPPLAAEPHAPFFWYETIQYFRENDDLTIYSVKPTIHHRVTVNYPQDLLVNVTFGHRLESDGSKFPEKRITTWELPAAFLGMSATTITWRRPPFPQEPEAEEKKGLKLRLSLFAASLKKSFELLR